VAIWFDAPRLVEKISEIFFVWKINFMDLCAQFVFFSLSLWWCDRLGNKAFGNKDFVQAIEHYTEAIKLDASNHVFFSNRSASYGGLGQWDKACTDAKECIRLNPTFIKGYYRLANAQMELKEYDSAAATIRQGLGVEGDNPQLLKQQRMVQQLKKTVMATENHKQTAMATSSVPIHGSSTMDSSTVSELQELQSQYVQMNRELETLKVNVMKSERESKMAEYTKADLDLLPPSSACYRSIGKMFLKESREDVVAFLNKNMETASNDKEDALKKMEYLEKKIKSQKQNMEELIKTSD
jgi:stress-induced-phosphoprotein 1